MNLLPSQLPSIAALRCFDTSARLLSFTRAAEEMHLTQGAVSHHVLTLEKQFGVKLFERRREGLELTSAGRTYWSDIATVLRHLERATETLIATKGQGGILNLSVSSSLANYWLMPRLQGFIAASPDVTLNISTSIGPIDFSARHEDASIEFCIGPEKGMEATLVMPLVLRPYISRELLVRFSDNADWRRQEPGEYPPREHLVQLLRTQALIRRSTVLDAWPGWLQQAGLEEALPASHQDSGPCYALLSLALNGTIGGLGIALLPEYITDNAVKKGQLVCLSPDGWSAPRAYYLRRPSAHPASEALRRFTAWIEALVATEANQYSSNIR